MLNEKQIKEYQKYYEARFRLEISREEAYEQASKLIRIMNLIYKPMLQQEYDDLQMRREKDSAVANNSNEKPNEDNPP
jgi:hypothetical protein